MSDTKSLSHGLTRRGFLKATGAAAGTLGLAGAMTATSDWLAPTTAIAEPEERKALICHQFHCLSSCGLECTVRDGRMVLIEPQTFEDGTKGQICLRGISEIQHTYSVDRIQTPLKRVGERGEGKFVQISWDEAIKTVADAIKESKEKYGEDSFFFRKSTEASSSHNYEYLPKLLHADTGGSWGLDRGQANGSDPSGLTGNGLAKNSTKDWQKASTIVFLGYNPFESSITWSDNFTKAKANGAKMILVDIRFSPTAQKCDAWLPVIPGTDLALILGAINAVISNEWYDAEHIRNYTSLPYLVNVETGEILGKPDSKTDSTGKTVEFKMPMIWDEASGSPKYINEDGIEPAIDGSWNIDGVEYTTQWELLKKQMKQYTPAWAAGVTSLDEQQIVDLADVFANNGPSILAFGFGGPDKYANADLLGHANAIFAAITGNTGKKGSGVGWYGGGGGIPSAQGMTAWKMPDEFKTVKNKVAMYDMPYKENNIHCALTFGDCFTLESGSANNMLDWVKTLDFFAICDIYHSSAVAYADIVLPALSKFESAEEVSDVRTGRIASSVYLNQKVIDPLFEAKGDREIERLIAAEFGLEEYIPESNVQLAKHMLQNPTKNMEGMTYEALREKGSMRFKGYENYLTGETAFPNQTYPTNTGRIELYYENLLDLGLAFPEYETPEEAYRENPKASEYPLMFVQGKSRYRIHAYYSASTWFQEYFGPVVNINPQDAEARGIATGDDVRIWNDRGEFVCTALINNSIMPGTLFMAETTYSQYYKEGFLQNVTNAYRQERCYDMKFGPQIPFNDTLVEMKKA